jgi:hypothetical protein
MGGGSEPLLGWAINTEKLGIEESGRADGASRPSRDRLEEWVEKRDPVMNDPQENVPIDGSERGPTISADRLSTPIRDGEAHRHSRKRICQSLH